MSKRAVLYARKSNKQDRTEEQSSSVADQLVRDRQYAERLGWTVVGEFSDDGISGLLDRTKRPGIDSALSMVERGEADVLVTLWTSRLSRDERDRAEYLNVLDMLKAEWHAVDDGGRIDRSTYAGYITYGVHTIFDVAYSKRIGENWRRAHERRLEAGLPKTTAPRFGYVYAKGEGYTVDEAEAVVVRELYRRYTRGDGFTTLVQWLSAEGWTVKGTGGAWSVRTLSRFMDSGFAAGFISREAHLRDSHKGSHKAVVTEAEWSAYRAARDERAKLGKKASGAGERWWLAGIVKCGSCGGSTYIDSFNRPTGLACCANHRANPGSCRGESILRSTVEHAVAMWLGPHLDTLDALANVEAGETTRATAAAYETAVQARDKVKNALADLEVQRALGDVDPSVFPIAKARLTEKLVAAEGDVQEKALALQQPEVDTALIRRDGWDVDQRAALRGVIDRVEIGRDALTIYPVTGEPVVRGRRDLAPRCEVFGCGKRHYTRGLCKSHAMRAKNHGVFEAVVQRIAEARDEPSLTVTLDEVETVLAFER